MSTNDVGRPSDPNTHAGRLERWLDDARDDVEHFRAERDALAARIAALREGIGGLEPLLAILRDPDDSCHQDVWDAIPTALHADLRALLSTAEARQGEGRADRTIPGCCVDIDGDRWHEPGECPSQPKRHPAPPSDDLQHGVVVAVRDVADHPGAEEPSATQVTIDFEPTSAFREGDAVLAVLAGREADDRPMCPVTGSRDCGLHAVHPGRCPVSAAEWAEPNPERPFGMARLLWHVWRHGHAVRTNRGITVPLGHFGRGWLYVCECGGVVAR